MAKLIIDALPLLFSGGISNYVAPFVQRLVLAGSSQWRIRQVFRLGPSASRWRKYREYRRRHLSDEVEINWTLLPDRVTIPLWEHGLTFPFFPDEGGDHVFIATTELVPKRRKGRVGWIVYDFTPYHLSEIFSIDKAEFLEAAARRAHRTDFIIAISESTKKDVVGLLNYPEDRVCVVYPGTNPNTPSASLHPFAPPGRRRYIYYLGSLAPSKNVDGMLRIFSRLIHAYHLDLDIVLTGKDFCGESFWTQLVRELKIEGRVHFTGWISDRDRDCLLDGALMLWQFSWYEGFGLPVLEAAGRGIPVMHTNRGSVPEILQNPEQQVDPSDEVEAAARAAAALSSAETLARWKRQGLSRAAGFTWEKSVNGFLKWLETMLKEKALPWAK
ncbi:MAG: glycosyltransferase family 1 protein [Thermodesulfobacteriota bacterium]